MLRVGNLVTFFWFPGLGVIIAQTLEEQVMRWLRAAELTCDRAALLVTQDSKVYFVYYGFKFPIRIMVTRAYN